MSLSCVVKGVGAYLPARIVGNDYFAQFLDTSDSWIQERTGIIERHFAAEGEVTSDLAWHAAAAALENAGVKADTIDIIVLATSTPDNTMPSTATRVQHKLGITRAAALDINAACSGFMYALAVADSMLKNGLGCRALVIGAETYSRILNYEDRGTCILFGDGAGAWVLEATKDSGERGIIYTKLYADGQYGDLLATDGGVSSTQQSGKLFMAGREIFRHGVAKMSEAIQEGLERKQMTCKDIDWLIPHQANYRILKAIGDKLGLPEEKLVSTVARHANTSAASIPLATSVALADGKLKSGDTVAIAALGAGLTWGCGIIKW